uniref:Uncharacterized protein n=1 Tax=viral metagenome TaxID=1070528 RepID=A0A6H1ZZU2_9ZZZZ
MGDSNIKVPFEPTEKFYEYLRNELKLSDRKAFKIIYYLQEDFEWEDEQGKHLGLLPGTYEKCRKCRDLYNSANSGCVAILCEGCCMRLCPQDAGNIECCEDCRLYKQLIGR